MHFLEGGGDEADEIDKLKSEEEEISTQHVVIANHSDMKQQDPLIQEFIHAQVCKKKSYATYSTFPLSNYSC